MASTLVKLAEIILSSVQDIERLCSEKELPMPVLDDVFNADSEVLFRADSDVVYSAKLAASAAMQLASTLLAPSLALYHAGAGHYTSAALRVAIECHVAEILCRANDKGMHVDDIAAPTGVDSARLGRSLRFLATQHIFREVEPNVFANNRLSSLLNTGKQAEEIRADRFHKYDGTNGFCALLEDLTSVSHKASTCVWENMADPFTAQSGEPNHSPFQRAFGTNKTYFEWQAEEEQKYISHRFGITMVGMASMRPANAILSAFDWHSLPHDSIVVDVGGGLATSAVPIAKAIPQVKIIVQDLPNVIEHSRKLLSKNHPELLNSGRIELQEHDFFTPQLPLMNASVFMLKQVLHDWSDDHCAKILQYLRDSAMPDAKLLIVDTVLSYALPGTPDGPKSKQTAPAPLLSNFGPADDLPYFMDFGMGAIINGQERTIGQLTDLLHRTGWQIVRVNYESDYYQPVLAVAV